ncbi:ATP-binding protein [Streptomyces sp. NPDC091279]|uniref:ATP-binding protein n=1 Tax=Streptomyces sp. NPDC091279 TaxID=3365983 RepID=UPI0038109378
MALLTHPAPWPGPLPAAHVIPSALPPHHAPRTATLFLPAAPRACAEARRLTERTLAAWELAHLSDDARAVAAELTANAVLHGRAHHPVDATGAAIRLRLARRPAHLLIAVTDQGADLPRYPQLTSPLQSAGRGLHIVEALAAHWGWTRDRPTGKTVWALLPTRPHH